jgi:hypothetical protein
MSLPTEPPLDNDDGLSLADVQGCVWYVWQLTLQDMEAYPTPSDLMPVKIEDSYPPRPWSTPSSPTGVVRAFFRDIQNTLEEHTGYRTDLDFNALIGAYDAGKTWGEFTDEIYAATYEAGGVS